MRWTSRQSVLVHQEDNYHPEPASYFVDRFRGAQVLKTVIRRSSAIGLANL